MIEEGLNLMVAGMGVVFLFLSLMVAVMYGSAAVLKRFDDKPTPPAKTGAGGKPAPQDDMAKVAVAVAAAKAHSRG